jgi:hypothetical protein
MFLLHRSDGGLELRHLIIGLCLLNFMCSQI